MPNTARALLVFGALSAALAVILGAVGAHALKGRVDAQMLGVWHTAVEYHFYHSLGLLAVGVLVAHFPASAGLRLAGWLMAAGIVLFCGSLYLLVLTGTRWLGVVTPLGGTSFIVAWLVAAWGAWRAA